MNFKFKYKTVLKYREDVEEQAKNALAAAISVLENKQNVLKRLESDFKKYMIAREKTFKRGLKASEFVFFEANSRYYREEIKMLEKQILNCREEVDLKRKNLLAATQEKKKMEKLKENEKRAFDKAEQYAETLLNDHIVTYKSAIKSGENTK